MFTSTTGDLSELIKMTDNGTYFCNYPNDLNIDNIKTSKHLDLMCVTASEPHVKVFKISRYADILSRIFFHSKYKRSLKVIIQFGEYIIYNKLFNDNLIDIKFDYGIPTIALPYQDVKVFLLGDSSGTLGFQEYLYLNTEDRKKLSTTNMSFGDLTVKDQFGIYTKKCCESYGSNDILQFSNNLSVLNIKEIIKPYLVSCGKDTKETKYSTKIVKEVSKKTGDYEYTFTIDRTFDLITNFFIEGGDCDIILNIGGNDLKNWSLNEKDKIIPFPIGIHINPYYDIKLKIISKNLPRVYTNGVIFSTPFTKENNDEVTPLIHFIK